MKRTIIVWDGMRMTGVTELPIKAGMNSSKGGRSKGITSFKRFL